MSAAAHQQLHAELGRFIGGLISLDQLCSKFGEFVGRNPTQRAVGTQWLQESVRNGRLSDAVWQSLNTVLSSTVTAQAQAEPTAAPPSPLAAAPAPATPSSGPVRAVTATAISPRNRPRVPNLGRPANPVMPPAVGPGTPPQRTFVRSAGGMKPQAQRMNTGYESSADVSTLTELRIGAVVKNRFTLIEEISASGMGRVFKARDRRKDEAQDSNPFVALKILSGEFERHPDSFIALQREARRAQTLAHPNVVIVYDFDRDGPHVFMTMEYLEGRPLDELLKAEFARGIPVNQAWPIIKGIGRALEYGHAKGIVHSDLKPGNVFLTYDGLIKVLDFGISRPLPLRSGRLDDDTFFDPDPAKRLGGLTPAYASMEMWDREPPDPRDDIYALACVAYELLTGRHPFAHASSKDACEAGLVPTKIEQLSRRQWQTLRAGLAFRRESRIASVREFLEGLAPISLPKRYRTLIGSAAAVTLLIGLVAGANIYRNYLKETLINEMGPERQVMQLSSDKSREQQIAESLWLAEDSLREASPQMSPDELSYVLSEGVNNVGQIVSMVLAQDPENKKALEIRASIADMYARKARQLLDQKNSVAAYELVRNGLRIMKTNRDLFELQQDICYANAAACKGAPT
jgi:serine/threonine protein kinase